MLLPRLRLRIICGLLFVVFCAVGSAKADPITITFEDVNTGGGTQPVSSERYHDSGVRIFNHADASIFVSSLGFTSNYVFAQRNSPLGGIGDGSLGVTFYIPGTSIQGVTSFVSFDVVDPGLPTPWEAVFVGRDNLLHVVSGSGSTTVVFTATTEDIIYFFILPLPQDTTGGIIGMDNLIFNTPTAVPAPEPATLLLLGTGLCGVGAAAYKRRRAFGRRLGTTLRRD